jgi:hypothetical protein
MLPTARSETAARAIQNLIRSIMEKSLSGRAFPDNPKDKKKLPGIFLGKYY